MKERFKKLFRVILMVFKFAYHTIVKPHPTIPIPCGHGTNPHYRLDPATDTVVQDGVDDIQTMIDACESSVNISNILKKYSQSGDPSLLRQRSEMFGDFSVMPGSFEESILTISKMRQNFDKLSSDVKSKYGITDFRSYLVACNNEIANAKVNTSYGKSESISEKEVTPNG